MRRQTPSPLGLTITAVERDTGIPKDTLRAWERRYGFPLPLRDDDGERVYPPEQVDKLRLVRRLLDLGHRPGRVMALPAAELTRLVAEIQPVLPAGTAAPADRAADPLGPDALLDALRAHQHDAFLALLAQARLRLGLARFVTDVIAPLNLRVGEAWMRGQLHIFEEHLYTEAAQGALRSAIAAVPAPPPGAPRVLLATIPGEPHGLGLLMAEAMLALEGARCLSLGTATPLWDIVTAATVHRCDIVALSFTGCMNPNQVVAALAELRAKLPAAVELWAGGMAPALHRRPIAGVRAVASLQAIGDELARWRGAAPAAA